MPADAHFGTFSITDSALSTDGQRKYISLNFPVYSNFIKGDYGVHILCHYNPTKTDVISANSFGNSKEGPSVVVLDGLNPAPITAVGDYSEEKMGWYEVFFDGTWNKYSTFNKVTINYYDDKGTEVAGIQSTGSTTIRYTYVAPDGKIYTRDRKVIFGTYEYDYTGSVQTFTTRSTGYYKIEGWGAQGNNRTTTGGNGGYISGTILLYEGDILSVSVGGQGLGGAAGANTIGGATGGQWTIISKGSTTLLVAGGGGGTASSSNISGGSGNGSGGVGTGTCSYTFAKTCPKASTCNVTKQRLVDDYWTATQSVRGSCK